MARPKKEAKEIKTNFDVEKFTKAVDQLKKNSIDPRTLVALRNGLVEHYLKGSITDDEQEVMELILRRERKSGVIKDSHAQILNKIEYAREDLLDNCVVKSENPPAVHHLKHGLECRYNIDYETSRYNVYIPMTIDPLWQMSNEAAMKIAMGIGLNESDLKPARIDIHFISIGKKEFDGWFEHVDKEILTEAAKEDDAVIF